MFTLPHTTHRATLAGIGTTGSLVAAVMALAAMTTGVVAFRTWPSPQRASPQTLEIGSGVTAGVSAPLLAPVIGVGRAGRLPSREGPPIVRENAVGAAGPAAPLTSIAVPGNTSGLPSIQAKSQAEPVSAPAKTPSPAAANVPKRLATTVAGTGHGTADTVGAVTETLGNATSAVSQPAGVTVSAGGLFLGVSVEKTTDGVVKLLHELGGGVDEAGP